MLPRGDLAPYRKVIDCIREHGKLFRFTYAPREFPRDDRRPLAPPKRALKREWMKKAEQLSAADLANASLLILRRDNVMRARMFAKGAVSEPKMAEGFSLEVRIHPDRHVAVLDSASPEDTTMGLERVEKLGGNSSVGLTGGVIEEKQTVESERG